MGKEQPLNDNKRAPRSGLRTAVAIIIALAAALLMRCLLAASPVAFAYPILTLVLYAFAGVVPAMTALLGSILAADLYFGTAGLAMSLVVFALPAAVMLRGVRWARPYPRQVITALGAQILGMVAALAIARGYVGSDIIDAFVNFMVGYMKELAPGMVDVFLGRMFPIDSVPSNITSISALQLNMGLLTAAQRADYLEAFAVQMHDALALALPGILLTSSTLTAIFATFLPNYMLRRQPGRAMCYIPVARWYTPWQVSLGLTGMLAVSYLLQRLGFPGGDALYATLLALLRLAFMIQAAISLERRLSAANKRLWMRVLLIAILEIFVSYAAVSYGGFSAFFGVTGAFKQLHARRGGTDKEDI